MGQQVACVHPKNRIDADRTRRERSTGRIPVKQLEHIPVNTVSAQREFREAKLGTSLPGYGCLRWNELRGTCASVRFLPFASESAHDVRGPVPHENHMLLHTLRDLGDTAAGPNPAL
jgi:hypothetical protein